jgi:hypothetical protein
VGPRSPKLRAARASRVEPAAVVARRGKNGSRSVNCSLRSLRLALLRQPGSVRRRAIPDARSSG